MFFYNQRALFLVVGGVFTALLIACLPSDPTASPDDHLAVRLVSGFWAISVVLTLLLHRRFTHALERWEPIHRFGNFPNIFTEYFIFDAVALAAMIGIATLLQIDLHFFAFLLLSNVVIWNAAKPTIGGLTSRRILLTLIGGLAFLAAFFMRPEFSLALSPAVSALLTFAPIVGMMIVTLTALTMISWLREREHITTLRQLECLGEIEAALSSPADARHADSPQDLLHRIRRVLRQLCSLGDPFWYDSACLWLLADHHDRGVLLVPTATWNTTDVSSFSRGIPYRPQILEPTPRIYRSHEIPDGLPMPYPLPSNSSDHIFASIPLVDDGRCQGFLNIFGADGSTAASANDRAFLSSLGMVLSKSLAQTDARARHHPLDQIDELLVADSPSEVLHGSVAIFRHTLPSAACIISVDQPAPPHQPLLTAFHGLAHSGSAIHTDAATALIPHSLASLTPIRIDDADCHLDEIDGTALAAMTKAIGTPIKSLLLVPLHDGRMQFGRLLLLNRRSYRTWFTQDDQQLALQMANRISALLQRFLHIQTIEDARRDAQANADQAQAAAARAERNALQRQEDLMVITHQLQGPLSAVRFGLALIRDLVQGALATRVEHSLSLVEDALALCYGTVTSFARDAGRQVSFGSTSIDVVTELRKLCERLKKTNTRPDLTLAIDVELDFPPVRMDKNVFTSVFYSLVHNAMKYSRRGTTLAIDCGWEDVSQKYAIKVKTVGERIRLDERDRIFEKYGRGNEIERTGRHHAGVGLGLWVARELMQANGGDLILELSAAHPDLSIFVVLVPKEEQRERGDGNE